jgi:hypothetical protein
MSDWIDLQLAHSLGPAKAPADLWDRIEAAQAPKRRAGMARWGVAAAAAAACVVGLLAHSAQVSRTEFATNDPAAIERWLAHEAGIVAPLRPAPGVCVRGVRLVRKGVAEVSYEVDGAGARALISRGEGSSACRIPGHTVTVASAKPEAACRLCHNL